MYNGQDFQNVYYLLDWIKSVIEGKIVLDADYIAVLKDDYERARESFNNIHDACYQR